MSLQFLITLAVAVASVAAQSLTVNTPTSVQACLPVQLSWTGGSPPYYISLIPGGQPGGAILKDFGQQSATSLTWDVDQPAGTSVSVQIRDSTGAINYSDKVTVQPSTKTCTPGSSASSGNTTASTATKSGTTPSASSNSSSNSSASTPASTSPTSTSPTASSPTASSHTPSTNGTTAPAGASASDASHNIPGIFALGFAAALAVFA